MMKRVEKKSVESLVFEILIKYDQSVTKGKKELLNIISETISYKPTTSSKYIFYNRYIKDIYFLDQNETLSKKAFNYLNVAVN